MTVGVQIVFLGVTVILSSNTNDLSGGNVPWMQTTLKAAIDPNSTVPFFGNATTWFDYTQDYIFIVGLSYFIKGLTPLNILFWEIISTNNKLKIGNPFGIEQGVSGFALPSRFCPTATPYYASNSNTCYSVCPAGYAADSTLFVCNPCIDGTYGSGSSCLSCPTGCATCTSATVCQTCTQFYYLNSTRFCIKPTYLLVSSSVTATTVVPAGWSTAN